MDAPPSTPAPEPAAPIRLRYRTTRGDHLRAAMAAGRRSDSLFAIGVALLVPAIGSLLVGDPISFAIWSLVGLSCLTGIFNVPFAWWALRSRPDLVGQEVEDVIDAHGIVETTPKTNARADWSLYREVFESSDAFHLSTGSGYGFIPKRAFEPAEIEAFRRLLNDHGLVRPSRRLRRLVTTIVVVALVVAFGAATVLVGRARASTPIDRAVSTVAGPQSASLPGAPLLSIVDVEGSRSS